MAIQINGYLTNAEETITVSSTAVGPTADTFGAGNRDGVLVEVLSNSILYTLHSPTATPDQNDKIAYQGDQFTVLPASKLRMIRGGTDSCVKLQGWVAA